MTAARSPFAVRGVIEGFYGNPWTEAQRLDWVRFIGERGMNTFVYGPKDDPFVRRRWREPYGAADIARLARLVAAGEAAGVGIVYAISPGLSIRYSSPDDLGLLLAKLEQVSAVGVSRFALLLDDIPPVLVHAEDAEAFDDLGGAHAFLAGAVAERLGPARELAVCPLVYHGRGDEPYLARLTAGLDPRIDVYWTGRAICSPTLDLEDARRFASTTGRPPLFWDNYPVNDVAMGWELHIGPYRGRDARLHEASRGILANPMELSEASKIPVATIADYLADPAGYDPEASVARAIREIAGGAPGATGDADAAAFALFAESAWSGCVTEDEATAVTATLAAFAAAVDDAAETGDLRTLAGAAEALRTLAEQLLAAVDHLLGGLVANPALVDECRPWIEAVAVGARAMCRASDLAADGHLPGDPARVARTLVPYLAELRGRRVRVFGDALDMFLADMTNTHTRPGRLLPVEGGGIL